MIEVHDIKPIRNRLRQFDSERLLRLLAERLHWAFHDPERHLRDWLPWYLMLLVKWMIGDDLSSSRRKIPTPRDVVDLRNRVSLLSNRGRLPSDFDSLHGFFRAMAFQQFWYQRPLRGADFTRQRALFDPMGTLFAQHIGLSVQQYLELGLVLGSRFMSPSSPEFTAAFFAPIVPRFGHKAIDRFLGLHAADLRGARELVRRSDERVRDVDSKMFEQSPFRTKPLLRLGDQYLCYSPSLLFDRLVSGAYDLLKAAEGERFTREFGSIFEKHLDSLLTEHHVVCLRERELQQLYPGRKLTDFTVPGDGAVVLIESKAVEMSPLAKVTPDAGSVRNHLRTSVIKAICQGMQTASLIAAMPPAGFDRAAKEFFLIVVTYKDLFIGAGQDFIVGEVEKEVRTFCDANGIDPTVVPAGNIAFASVAEFEMLVASCAANSRAMSAVLRAAAIANRDVRTKRFNLEQHIDEAFPKATQVPGSLNKTLDELCAGLLFDA